MGLEIVEFIMTVEERFGIELPDTDVEQVETIGEFHRLVQRKLEVAELPPSVVAPRAATDPTPCALLELLGTLPAWPPPHRPIWDEIRAILIQQFDIPPHQITPNARFVKDLGMG